MAYYRNRVKPLGRPLTAGVDEAVGDALTLGVAEEPLGVPLTAGVDEAVGDALTLGVPDAAEEPLGVPLTAGVDEKAEAGAERSQFWCKAEAGASSAH
jgi:hypothetical protein